MPETSLLCYTVFMCDQLTELFCAANTFVLVVFFFLNKYPLRLCYALSQCQKRGKCHTGISMVQVEGLQVVYYEWKKMVLQFYPGMVSLDWVLESRDFEESWKR